jgi:hypothetical protein
LILQAYVVALSICAASLLVGRVALALAGQRKWCWLEPGIGFAVLVGTGGAVAWASGSSAASSAALLGAVLLATILAARLPRSAETDWRQAAAVAALLLAAMALPFLAAGHWGLLGLENLTPQAQWAGWLHHGGTAPPAENVLGPVALADTLARVPGIELGQALQGELFAVVTLAGLTAIGAFGNLGGPRRALAACMVAIAYLSASFLTLAALPIVAEALLVLTAAVALVQVERRIVKPPFGEEQSALESTSAATVAATAIGAGIFFSNSVAGLVWPVAIAARWSLNRPEVRARLRPGALPALLVSPAVVVALLVVAALALLAAWVVPFSVSELAAAGTGEPVSPFAGLGIWLHGTYVLDGYGAEDWAAGLVAAGTLTLAVVWWLRRRETAAPVAFGVSSVIYLLQPVFANQYTRAQALAMVAPFAMLVAIRPLLEESGASATPPRRGPAAGRRPARPRSGRTAWALLAIVYIGAAVGSSGLALTQAPVYRSSPADAISRPSRGPGVVDSAPGVSLAATTKVPNSKRFKIQSRICKMVAC